MWILNIVSRVFWGILSYLSLYNPPIPPITLPPPKQLPSIPFDQLFVDYAKEKGNEVIEKHRKRGNNKCSFIHRKVYVEVPPTLGDYNSATDDFVQNRNTLLSFRKGERPYLLHVPHGVEVDSEDGNSITQSTGNQPSEKKGLKNIERLPLVIIVHGTDETAFDNELLDHVKGSQTWLEKSDSQNFILASVQARGMWGDFTSNWRPEGDFIRTLFKIGNIDKSCADYFYIHKVIQDILQICPQADISRMFLVGFSNGGYLACDFSLLPTYNFPNLKTPSLDTSSSPSPSSSSLPENNIDKVVNLFKEHPFRAICLYMGGITDKQIEKSGFEKAKLSKFEHIKDSFVENGENKCEHKLKNNNNVDYPFPDVCIFTGHYDPQIFSCHKAWQVLHELGYYVTLENIPDVNHEYLAESTDKIWNFFENSPHYTK